MSVLNRLGALRDLKALGSKAALTGLLLLTMGSAFVESPVADAAQRGDLEAVRTLLRSGSDVNAAQGDGMTALHWAADRGDVELGQTLVYAGASVHAGTRIGSYTPLHIAARAGRDAFVRMLLDAGSDPHAVTTNSGTTPLHLAAAAGAGDAVTALVKAGSDVNVREGVWGQTPLIFAAASGRVAAIKALLTAGADPALASTAVDVVERADADEAAEDRIQEFLDEFRDKEGGGPAWRPAPSQVQAAIEAAREIQRNWPNVPHPDDDNADDADAPNDEAEHEGEASPADSDSLTADSETAESETAESETSDSDAADPVQAADAADTAVADSTEAEEDEPRPLSYAQMVGQWGGLTPLLHAVRQGHKEAALALIKGGADINQPSAGDQTTPILMAALNGQFDLAIQLLELGADPNGPSAAGTTPLFAVLERTWAPRSSYAHPQEQYGQQATHLDVMAALLEAGADPNVRLNSHLWYMEYTFGVLRGSGINLKGATPFWRAAYALDIDAMRLLKEHGADPGIPTMKPPERRRPPMAPEEAAADSLEPAALSDTLVTAVEMTGDTPVDPEVAESVDAENPTKGNAEGESSEGEGEGDEEEEDHSGVPPVPVGGPAIYPIHAASGVGYGQSFAGNAHRYVPGNWLAAVKFLVEECGADVNQRDHNAYTPLHHAASRGDTEMVRYFVGLGADVTVLSRKGQTTADMANGPVQRVRPFPETLNLLVELGATNNDKCVSCE